MKICTAWRVARLESPLHSADIGVVWGANLPLRSRPPRCGSLIGLWVTMASTIVQKSKQHSQLPREQAVSCQRNGGLTRLARCFARMIVASGGVLASTTTGFGHASRPARAYECGSDD